MPGSISPNEIIDVYYNLDTKKYTCRCIYKHSDTILAGGRAYRTLETLERAVRQKNFENKIDDLKPAQIAEIIFNRYRTAYERPLNFVHRLIDYFNCSSEKTDLEKISDLYEDILKNSSIQIKTNEDSKRESEHALEKESDFAKEAKQTTEEFKNDLSGVNSWCKLFDVSAKENPFFPTLPILELVKLSALDKATNATVMTYLQPLSVRLQMLDEISQSFVDFIHTNKRELIKKYVQIFESILMDGGFNDVLNNELSGFKSQVINHLLKLQTRGFEQGVHSHVIPSFSKESQVKVLSLFFEHASDAELEKFLMVHFKPFRTQFADCTSHHYKSQYAVTFWEQFSQERMQRLSSFLMNDINVDIQIATLCSLIDLEVGITKSDKLTAKEIKHLVRDCLFSLYQKNPAAELWKEVFKKYGEWFSEYSRRDTLRINVMKLQIMQMLLDKKESGILNDEILSLLPKLSEGRLGNEHMPTYLFDLIDWIYSLQEDVGVKENLLSVLAYVSRKVGCEANFCLGLSMAETLLTKAFSPGYSILDVAIPMLLCHPEFAAEEVLRKNVVDFIIKSGRVDVFIRACQNIPEPMRSMQLMVLSASAKIEMSDCKRSSMEKAWADNHLSLEAYSAIELNNFYAYSMINRCRFMKRCLGFSTQAQWENIIAKCKSKEIYLYFIASGLTLPNGTLYKVSQADQMIKAAFKACKLSYKGYSQQPLEFEKFINDPSGEIFKLDVYNEEDFTLH